MEKKKNDEKRIERKIPLFFLIGLNAALLLAIAAFEWKSEEANLIDLENVIEPTKWDSIIYVPQPPPPRPKPPQTPNITESEEEPDDPPIDIVIDVEPPEKVPEIIFKEDIPDEKPDEAIHDVVQVEPEFPGGWNAFYKFVGSNIEYPAQERRMGIEGKVFVRFVIEKDGSLSNIQIIRGLSPRCDDETMRVLKQVPNFKPARHNGKTVRKRMILPVNFKLDR